MYDAGSYHVGTTSHFDFSLVDIDIIESENQDQQCRNIKNSHKEYSNTQNNRALVS